MRLHLRTIYCRVLGVALLILAGPGLVQGELRLEGGSASQCVAGTRFVEVPVHLVANGANGVPVAIQLDVTGVPSSILTEPDTNAGASNPGAEIRSRLVSVGTLRVVVHSPGLTPLSAGELLTLRFRVPEGVSEDPISMPITAEVLAAGDGSELVLTASSTTIDVTPICSCTLDSGLLPPSVSGCQVVLDGAPDLCGESLQSVEVDWGDGTSSMEGGLPVGHVYDAPDSYTVEVRLLGDVAAELVESLLVDASEVGQPGDATNDCRIDSADLSLLLTALDDPTYPVPGDGDCEPGDGVTVDDLTCVVQDVFGGVQ